MDPILEELNKTEPTKKFRMPPFTALPPDYILHFLADPLNQGNETCVRNHFVLPTAPKKMFSDEIIS